MLREHAINTANRQTEGIVFVNSTSHELGTSNEEGGKMAWEKREN